MKLEYTLTPCTKINSKWLKDLNIRQNTIKLLEENISKTFSDTNHTNVFLRRPVSQSNRNKNKNNQWDLNKLTSFCTAKETIKKPKRQTTEREKIVANDATDKGLISKIHKQPIPPNSKKTNDQIEKFSKILNRHSSKEDIWMANRHMKKMINITNY